MILALDLATHTGWAVGPRGRRAAASGVLKLPAPVSWGAPMCALIDWAADTCTVFDVAEIWLEAAMPASRQVNDRSARLAFYLAGAMHTFGYRRDVPIREAHAATVRARVVGNGRAKKDDVAAWCRAQGYAPADHNAADALALHGFAAGFGCARSAA